MLNKVLVPIDRSKFAEQAFPAVTELAKAFGSEVVIFGVCEAEGSEEEQACQLYMGSKAEELGISLTGSAATSRIVVVSGRAAEQILSYAEVEKFDLIVMSSHGKSGITRWSLGSTADKVLRKAGIPLIIIRAKEPPQESSIFGRILVPIDGSERSTAILPFIEGLAAKLPCEVCLVEVVEPGMHVRTIGGLDYVPFKERDTEETKDNAKKYLEKVSANLASTKAKVTCEVRAGDVAQEILNLANEKGCTLIAMSSHGHSGIEAWSMGSIAAKIVEATTQSVWLVPSFARK
ncbi:MAG: universal stress protein [Chloroflexota bacterium]